MSDPHSCTAFAGVTRIAEGPPSAVAGAVHRHLALHPEATVLVFDDITAQPVEFDLRGSAADVAARFAPEPEPEPEPARGRGRPKLGVVAREVTLLPRHWDWLAAQPGGASVALRKLVDAARAANTGKGQARAAQAAAHRFMTALAGNQPGYEDALRALYAGDRRGFEHKMELWPADIAAYARALADDSF